MSLAAETIKNLEKISPKNIPAAEPLAAGHRACQGCGEVAAMRMCVKAAGDIIVTSATGCMEIIASPYPQTAWEVPWVHVAFENVAAVASGVEAGRKALIRKGRIKDSGSKIVAFAGDGGTCDIGLQALSGALERGHDFTYICLDNEAYMNTGIQRSSSTPFGATTTTSPAGKKNRLGQVTWKKNLPMIAAAHNIPYVATASPAYHLDLMNKIKKAVSIPGPAYVHIFAPCPTGWRCDPALSIETSRMVVQNRMFPLYEVIDGRFILSRDVPNPKPLEEYLKIQRRFRHLKPEDIAYIQERVTRDWEHLLALCKATNPEGTAA